MTPKKCSLIDPSKHSSEKWEVLPLATEKDYREAHEKFVMAYSFNTSSQRDKLYYLMTHVARASEFSTLIAAGKLIGLSRLALWAILNDYQELFYRVDSIRNIWITAKDAEHRGLIGNDPLPIHRSSPPSEPHLSDKSLRPRKSGITCASLEEIEAAAIATINEYQQDGYAHLPDDEILYQFMSRLHYPARERDLKSAVYNILGYSKAESSFRKALNSERYLTPAHGVKQVKPVSSNNK